MVSACDSRNAWLAWEASLHFAFVPALAWVVADQHSATDSPADSWAIPARVCMRALQKGDAEVVGGSPAWRSG